MKKKLSDLPKEKLKKLSSTISELTEQDGKKEKEPISWYDGKNIDELAYCEYFIRKHPLRCIQGRLYDINGLISDTEFIRKEILDDITVFVRQGIARKAARLLETLMLMAYSEMPDRQTDRIHTLNGTYFVDGRFSREKEFCLNRLSVNYNPNAAVPKEWYKFLRQLFDDEDILTLQEYMGYCFLPTTKGQKMMIIVGNGGEGKSRIGRVMRALIGDNMNTGGIQKFETDRFSRADQEGKLLFLDDDMMLEALPQTNYLKAIITLEDKIDLEKKGQQSIQGILYLRIMCFSNGNLNALYDRSIGFFRRQLVLSVKRKEPDRVDDPFIAEKLIAEKEGIFLWCLQGLERLLKNNYLFTISEKAKANVENAMIEGNNIIMFMKSKGYIVFDKNCSSKSRDLYRSYAIWCDENLEKPLSERTFTTYLKQNQTEYGIEYIPNLTCKTGKTARGYKGIYCIPITPII